MHETLTYRFSEVRQLLCEEEQHVERSSWEPGAVVGEWAKASSFQSHLYRYAQCKGGTAWKEQGKDMEEGCCCFGWRPVVSWEPPISLRFAVFKMVDPPRGQSAPWI